MNISDFSCTETSRPNFFDDTLKPKCIDSSCKEYI